MDFLDSLDLHTTDEKSKRVRSWYLYEQYKSLEKSQLDAAKKLKHKSFQDRILHRELSERRARRQFSQEFDLRHSESHLERTRKSDSSRTPYSESTHSFFESVCEQEDVENNKEQEDTYTQHSEASKSYNEFKSSDDKINNSCSESIKSVIENTEINENFAADIKDELESVKKNIAEIINLQIETEKECLEKYTEICDNNSCVNECLKSTDKHVASSTPVDKYYPKYDNGLLTMWSKLVRFSYNVMQMNRGNCYYDYSSQFLTGVLAFDVLRRGINRMCHILQPYVSPIKFASDEYDDSSLTNVNVYQKCACAKKCSKIVEQKYCPLRTLKYNERKYRSLERTYRSEDKWQSCNKYSVDNRINEVRARGTSEPWRSVAKFSGTKSSFKKNLSCNKSTDTSQTDRYSSYCNCQQLKKAINPIIKLSYYIDMILEEIQE